MKTTDLTALGERLKSLGKKQSLWQPPTNASVLLQDLYQEFVIHRLAVLNTLVSAHGMLRKWDFESDQPKELKDRLLLLAIGSIEAASSALEADNVERFSELASSIIESASKLLGLGPLMTVFETHSALKKILELLNLRHSELSAIDEMLPLVEAAMERMLLVALWVDSQVAAITEPVVIVSDVPLEKTVEILKAPIVRRIIELRTAMHAADGNSPRCMRLPEEGLWPAGLRKRT
jgi:hypothetical protein